VVATARNPATLTDLVAPHGERALALQLDVTRQAEIDRAVAAARERFGPIDGLINNAGYGGVGTVEETPVEVAREMMETNYFGALAMTRAVVAEMIARGAGRIVNIGSVAGQVGFPALGYYCGSKFALAGLTESLAAELRPLGVWATLAELGPFETNFARAMTVNPPAAHYDMAALTKLAGNAAWTTAEDPRAGAAALLAALDDPEPPVRLILGQPGLDVIELHDGRRAEERKRWMRSTTLRDFL
jgi:NAD(P)-dependent dehydrogenase (short-subunit alcohol dehydrogenase family)